LSDQVTESDNWKIFSWVFLATIIGLLIGQLGWALAICFAMLFFRYYQYTRDLNHWLSQKKPDEPPEFEGIRGGIYNHILRLTRRNRNQKKKLAAALTRFQQAASAMPDGVVILASDGIIEWANNRATRLLGIKTPADANQAVTNLIRNPAFLHYLTDEEFEEPFDLNSPVNEEIILSIRIVPYGKDQKLLIARDMSRVLRLERTRRDFVANVSHELRTPLTVITGYLETIRDNDAELESRWGKQIDQMENQSSRMQKLIDDLLLLSRLETSKQASNNALIKIPSMMDDFVLDAKMLSGKKQHNIHAKIETDACINGDQQELQSAFYNLISNAIRYTPEKGDVTIRWYQDGDDCCFEVRDSGIGIPKHTINRLTERFFRVDTARSRESGGTGLGLAIVKHVLGRHDGQLEISSQYGVGSTFRCRFPASRISHP